MCIEKNTYLERKTNNRIFRETTKQERRSGRNIDRYTCISRKIDTDRKKAVFLTLCSLISKSICMVVNKTRRCKHEKTFLIKF